MEKKRHMLEQSVSSVKGHTPLEEGMYEGPKARLRRENRFVH